MTWRVFPKSRAIMCAPRAADPPVSRGEASAAEPSLLLSLPGASVLSLASACVSWARNSQRVDHGH